MRDLLVAFIVFGSLPFILRRPFLGILMLTGLGYMNPHRLTYGFMYTMPVVQIVAIATLIGMLVSKEAKRMVWSREIVVLLAFVAWMGLTTTQAFFFDQALGQYEKVIKIQIITFMTLILLTSRERVHLFVWVLVLSLGFYGVKGGLFTLAHGGVYRVQGPPGTFLGGNNEMAMALVMTIPLMRYLQLQEQRHWVRLGLAGAVLLSALAAFGSQSRGALVALIITGGMFWLKSRRKLATAFLIVAAGVLGLATMPDAWFERMRTIETYEADRSAQGRINQWGNAINIANDRIFGGGFETWKSPVCRQYAPNPDDCRDVHSIYFEVLGEHGWVGLSLFLALLVFTWRKCSQIAREAAQRADLQWSADLARMTQVAIAAYMSAGAFLGLAYFDYIYHLVALVVVTHHLIRQEGATAVTSDGAIVRPSI